MRSHPETPLLRWPCNELSLCGAGLPRGSVEDIPSLQDQLPRPTQSTEPRGLMICAGFGMSGCNFRPQMFLAPRSLGGTVSLILRGEILWGPACNLRHIRHFAGQSAFAANWVIHFWLLTPEVIKKAIPWGHWISHQLFYSINSSWERLGWETHSPTAASRAAFWQHWRCWAGVHSGRGSLLWKKNLR